MFKHCVQMCSKVQTCAKLCKIVQTLLTCDASSVLIFHVNAAKTHLLQFGICMKSGALGSCPRHIAEVSWIKVLRATYRNKSTPELQESWGIGLSYHIINSYHISEFWGFNAFSEATWDLWTWAWRKHCPRSRRIGTKLQSPASSTPWSEAWIETSWNSTDHHRSPKSDAQWRSVKFEKLWKESSLPKLPAKKSLCCANKIWAMPSRGRENLKGYTVTWSHEVMRKKHNGFICSRWPLFPAHVCSSSLRICAPTGGRLSLASEISAYHQIYVENCRNS